MFWSIFKVPMSKDRVRGQSVKIVNIHGSQVVDTWAFAIDKPEEYLSMPATRRLVYRLMPINGADQTPRDVALEISA